MQGFDNEVNCMPEAVNKSASQNLEGLQLINCHLYYEIYCFINFN